MNFKINGNLAKDHVLSQAALHYYKWRVTGIFVISLQYRMGANHVFLGNPWANSSSTLSWPMFIHSHLSHDYHSLSCSGPGMSETILRHHEITVMQGIIQMLSKPDDCWSIYYVSIPQLKFDQSHALIQKWLRTSFLKRCDSWLL